MGYLLAESELLNDNVIELNSFQYSLRPEPKSMNQHGSSTGSPNSSDDWIMVKPKANRRNKLSEKKEKVQLKVKVRVESRLLRI